MSLSKPAAISSSYRARAFDADEDGPMMWAIFRHNATSSLGIVNLPDFDADGGGSAGIVRSRDVAADSADHDSKHQRAEHQKPNGYLHHFHLTLPLCAAAG